MKRTLTDFAKQLEPIFISLDHHWEPIKGFRAVPSWEAIEETLMRLIAECNQSKGRIETGGLYACWNEGGIEYGMIIPGPNLWEAVP